MALADDLGNLILNLNPYTNGETASGKQTGQMDIYVGNPNPAVPPAGNIGQIELEVDTNYPYEWEFKEEDQKVRVAARIKYRYPVLDATGKPLYWIEDYLLIGFEGSGGP